MLSLPGSVLITGASSGIGLEFAKQYAAAGWKVIATHRHAGVPESLAELNRKTNNFIIERMDVRSLGEVTALAEKVGNLPIDLIINNAGIFSLGVWLKGGDAKQQFGSLDYDEFAQYMEINARGPVMVAERFIDNVRAGHGKKIVAISSTIGTISEPTSGVNAFWYGTSKAALNKIVATLAVVLKRDGIAVVPIHPGSVRVERQPLLSVSEMIETRYSVSMMIDTISRLSIEDTGRFILYDGSPLPW